MKHTEWAGVWPGHLGFSTALACLLYDLDELLEADPAWLQLAPLMIGLTRSPSALPHSQLG